MEEMIAAEAQLPREIESAGRLGELLAEGGPVLFTGCGTSEHASMASAAIAGARARDAFEASLDLPQEGLVVAVSHDAGTAATLAAAKGAPRAVLITARPDDAPDGLETIVTPRHDESWCHTIGYLSPFLTTALAVQALTVEDAERVIAAELGARDTRREEAERLGGAARILAVGSGVDEITSRELALKIEEGTHVPVIPLGTEKALHGHLPAHDATSGAVLIRFDPDHAAERDARTQDAHDAMSVLGMPLVTLRPAEPVTGTAEALLAGAIALQLLTLELTHVLGTNPDLIRREDDLYRRVAEAAGAG